MLCLLTLENWSPQVGAGLWLPVWEGGVIFKMGLEDVLEALLETLECVAGEYQWPRVEWPQ